MWVITSGIVLVCTVRLVFELISRACRFIFAYRYGLADITSKTVVGRVYSGRLGGQVQRNVLGWRSVR